MLLFLIDSSGNLIYEGQHKHYLEQDTDQHHHHDSRSLRFLPLMAAQSVLEEEFGNERISGVKLADGSTAAFYQVDLITFIIQSADPSISIGRLEEACRLIRGYLHFTWGECVEEWLDSYNTRHSNTEVVNRRLQSLLGYFEGLSSATGLSLPWIGAESLQVSADVRQYCERLVSLAISDCRLAEYSIADVPSPIIHHVLLTVGTKMLCTHSAVQGHTLHPHDLAMISIRLAERQRSKTIANETEMIWLMKGDHNEHDGEESQRQCRRERYIMYIGRITPGVTAVILRYCASELSIEPLSPPSSLIDPQMLLDCSRLQAILQQSAQNTNEGDEILARSGLPSLEQLTEFLVCKDQSHVSMLPYWTMFPGLVYFISRDPRTGHTMMPTIDDNLYSGTSTGVERCACDQKQIQSLMFEWIRQSKDMSLHHDCLVVRNTTFSFAFCRTIPVDNNASNGLEISSSHGSHSLIWSIWLADIPVDSIRKFFFVFPKSF